MIVCFDAQAALGQRAGVGRYARSLVEALARRPGDHRLRPFFFDARGRPSPFSDAVPESARARWPRRVVQWSWNRFGAPPFERFAPAADLYHFPNFVVPPLRGRAVVTVHDASFLRVPETVEARNLRFLRRSVGPSLERADAVLANSRFTAAEYEELFPEARGKIVPIPLGLSPRWRRPAPEAIETMRRRHGLPARYVLFVGTIEPRKSLPLLLDAMERLGAADVSLVVAGRPGWKCDDVVRRLEAAGASGAAHVRWLRDLSDGELPALYAGAELFAFPSRYEGFGFPPLEAMRCGTAVVASARASLPEVLGDAARLVADDHPDAWAGAIRELLSDPERRARLARDGAAHAAGYTWEATADATLEVYRRVAAGEPPVSGRIPAPRDAPAHRP